MSKAATQAEPKRSPEPQESPEGPRKRGSDKMKRPAKHGKTSERHDRQKQGYQTK